MSGTDRTDGVFETDVVFPPDADFFAGHFPGFPVTPGVVLLGRAVEAAERLLEQKARLTEVKKVKFSDPVLPGEAIRLRIERRNGGEFAYTFRKGDSLCASGTLVFQN